MVKYIYDETEEKYKSLVKYGNVSRKGQGGKTLRVTSKKSRARDAKEARADRMAAEKKRLAKQKKLRLAQIKVKKASVLAELDARLKKGPGQRLSSRGQLRFERDQAGIKAARQYFAKGEGEVWANKLQNYLKPTEKKFNAMSKRLTRRPRLSRAAIRPK